MYNFRALFYSDSTAIFNADDPAHSSTSPYGYVGGNPVSFTDPTGMVKNPMAPPPDYLSMEADWLDARSKKSSYAAPSHLLKSGSKASGG